MKPHYELTGPDNAPVVVLSNSLGTDLTMWDDQLRALTGKFRVLRYDQRGHGKTPGTPGPYTLDQLGGDVLELLDHLEIERVHFAGVSLGGMTGMWLAEHAADRIGQLALICTSAELGPPQNWRDRAATVREQGTSALVEGSLTRWFTPALAGREDIVAKFGAMIEACDDEGYASCAEAIAEMDLLPRLADITAGTLVIAGRDDPATPPAHAERIADTVKDARLAVLDNAAHLANVEQSTTVNHLLLDHFGRSS